MKNTDDGAGKRVFIKVFGFSDAERHALNTAFLLSESRSLSYGLWSTQAAQAAQVAFVDGESWEATLELAKPEHDELKLVWVGERPPAKAWQVFARPLQWAAVIDALDGSYAPSQIFIPDAVSLPAAAALDIDFDLDLDLAADVDAPVELDFDLDLDLDMSAAATSSEAPSPDTNTDFGAATEPQPLSGDDAGLVADSRPRVLVIDSDLEARMYWRARLAIAGMVLVDDVATGEAALHQIRFNMYSLVILDLELSDMKSWKLFTQLEESTPPIAHLILTGSGMTLLDRLRARFTGATAALPKPLQPGQVKQLLDSLQTRQIP
ncbi:MAG: response regulator [Polaromonas sp.]|nr:response regulator [Polaromonas sp.]